MHLVYLCQDKGIPVDGTKGSSIHVRSMVRALAANGVTVTLLSPRIGDTVWAQNLPIDFRTIPKDKHGVRDFLDEIHSAKPVDGVYERLSLWANSGSQWSRNNNVPHAVEVNAPLADEAAAHRGLQDVDEARKIEREVTRNANLLFPVSPWLKQWLWNSGVHIGNIMVLPNAVPSDWIVDDQPLLPEKGKKTKLGFVGSLRPWHDLKSVIRAVALMPEKEYELVIVGDGPMRDELGDLVKELNMDHVVHFTGKVEHCEIVKSIDEFDICLAPYAQEADFYFCPIKIYEYGARRKPVVAPGLPELIEQFAIGSFIRYNAGDASHLAEMIQMLMDNPRIADSTAKGLYSIVCEHTWEKHAQFVVNEFQALGTRTE